MSLGSSCARKGVEDVDYLHLHCDFTMLLWWDIFGGLEVLG